MRRFFGFIVFFLALLGGLHAIGSAVAQNQEDSSQMTFQKEAEGFASGFIQSYLTLPAEKSPIAPFTSLKDIRPRHLTDTSQEVIGVWALKSQQDSLTQLVQVELLVLTKSYVKEVNKDREKEIVRQWKTFVQVSQNPESGKLAIFRYPSLFPLEKGKGWLPEIESYDGKAADSMKPMLESFFKTYLSANKPEDIANFFSEETSINPKGGILVYQDIQQIEAYGESTGPWLVFVDVKIEDPVTKSPFMESYQLQVVNQQGKYFIQTMIQ